MAFDGIEQYAFDVAKEFMPSMSQVAAIAASGLTLGLFSETPKYNEATGQYYYPSNNIDFGDNFTKIPNQKTGTRHGLVKLAYLSRYRKRPTYRKKWPTTRRTIRKSTTRRNVSYARRGSGSRLLRR